MNQRTMALPALQQNILRYVAEKALAKRPDSFANGTAVRLHVIANCLHRRRSLDYTQDPTDVI
jgi:hypothetical protein